MNSAKKAFKLVQLGTGQLYRSAHTTRVPKPYADLPPSFLKMKAKQEKFQVDDGLPVHLKGGMMDKVLYQTTMALSVISIGFCLHLVYSLAVPRN